MLKNISVLTGGITLFCLFYIARILASDAGSWGFGYAFIWVFPVIWLVGIGIDTIIKMFCPDKLVYNIAGTIILLLFLFIVFSQ